MVQKSINSLIDMLAVSGQARARLEQIVFQDGVHIIIPVEYLGFVGGNITQISPDQYGRIIFKNWIITPLLACGHITRSIKEIAGTCIVCKRLICTQCLYTCDLTGSPVCRMHSFSKDGLVIGNHAKKGLWRFKAWKVREEKELGFEVRKQLPHK